MSQELFLVVATVPLLLALFIIYMMVVIVPAREAVIKERLGKFVKVMQPGLHFMIPIIDRAAYRQEMREQVIDVEPQTAITQDNIQLEVDGVIYIKVMDAEKATYKIANYRRAAVNLAQTTMRSEIGKISLDRTFSERDSINENIVREIDKASDSWGIKVLRYEIRNITPPPGVIETLEKQMEAERQKRASITLATAERDSLINISEGERQEAVNVSEGEKQKRINEAHGRAKEISLVADATAKGLKNVAGALQKPGGNAALKMQLVDQYITELGKVLRSAQVNVVPTQLANIKGIFEGIARTTATIPSTTPGEGFRGGDSEKNTRSGRSSKS
ncbi:MAG: paraslipin [SAR324 cluster bacterium]|nr:paraslipin [SAR324 cluster bacterium]